VFLVDLFFGKKKTKTKQYSSEVLQFCRMKTSTNAATTTTKWVGSKLQWEGPRIKTANNRSVPKSPVKTELLLPSSLQQSHNLLEVLEMEGK
jgi:hypothetical protein